MQPLLPQIHGTTLVENAAVFQSVIDYEDSILLFKTISLRSHTFSLAAVCKVQCSGEVRGHSSLRPSVFKISLVSPFL